MVDGGESVKVGGEYGEIRSQLDVGALNAWIGSHRSLSQRVMTPVDVKQFAVSVLWVDLVQILTDVL